jgi:hypothetical protein
MRPLFRSVGEEISLELFPNLLTKNLMRKLSYLKQFSCEILIEYLNGRIDKHIRAKLALMLEAPRQGCDGEMRYNLYQHQPRYEGQSERIRSVT